MHCQTAFEEDKLRFKNYIRTPKANNYQSLHAVFRMADGQWVEVQVGRAGPGSPLPPRRRRCVLLAPALPVPHRCC